MIGELSNKDLLDALVTNIEYLMPSEIAEKYRVLSTGKFKGPFSFKRSPYAREFVDTLSPMCNYSVIGIEKGSQIGMTMAGYANILLAIMIQYQCDVLFMSDTEEQVKRAMNGFIDDMIREAGLCGVIGKNNDRSRKKTGTGDTTKEKKFGGVHTLYTWSGQTVGKLSSISPKVSLNDEVERYTFSDKKAGSPYSLIMNRHKTYSGEYKAYFGSTPEQKETSVIHPIYMQGDRKHFFIPCPHCGEYIDFQWTVQLEGKEHAGMHYKRTNTGSLIPESVGYVCQKCGGFFKEQHKFSMYSESEYMINNSGGMMWKDGEYVMANGDKPLCQWIPTADAVEPDYGSYHISALYSGAGFHTWKAIAKEWCLANPVNGAKNFDMIKTFYNQELGLPWEERTRQLSANKILNNNRTYDIGTIPDMLSKADGNGDIILLTLAVDLNGRMGDTVDDDDVRLDWEIVAWCERGDEKGHVVSYSIDHGSIGNFERKRDREQRLKVGDDRNVDQWTYRHGYENSVWPELEKILYADYHRESGGKMRIQACGVDTGGYTAYAYEFVNKHDSCVSLKGSPEGEYMRLGSKKTIYSNGKTPKLYHVEGNFVKDLLAEEMEFVWDPQKNIKQPEGFMNFPEPAEHKYTYKTFYHEFENEKRELKLDALKRPVGMRWVKKHSAAPQHFFDVRLYNMAVRSIAMTEYCKQYKVELTWDNFAQLMKTYL